MAINKADLGLAAWAQDMAGATVVSATRGDGLDELARRIVAALVGDARYEPGRAVVFTERQAVVLEKALGAIEAGRRQEAARSVEEVLTRTQ